VSPSAEGAIKIKKRDETVMHRRTVDSIYGTPPANNRIAGGAALWHDLTMAEVGYTALVKKVGDWWIGWVQEIPGVNAQERTKEELLASLSQALREVIEFNREDARRAADSDYVEEPLAL
jgi:predicted RNase H-like HicB family nuclease